MADFPMDQLDFRQFEGQRRRSLLTLGAVSEQIEPVDDEPEVVPMGAEQGASPPDFLFPDPGQFPAELLFPRLRRAFRRGRRKGRKGPSALPLPG